MLSNRSQGHTVLFFELRLARVYLLDYITSTEIFQIGDRKKKKKKKKKKEKDIGPIYQKFYVVYQS